MRADVHEPVKALAVDQGLKPRSDVDIGRRLSGLGVTNHAYGIVCPGLGKVTHMGFKAKDLRLAVPCSGEIDGYEGCVIHRDPDLFHRGHKEIFPVFHLQDRRE